MIIKHLGSPHVLLVSQPCASCFIIHIALAEMIEHILSLTVVCTLIALPTNNFIVALSNEMGEFQEKLDTIQFLMCSPLKARHWEVIQQLPGNKVVNPTVLTIQTLAYLKVHCTYTSDCSNRIS